MKQRGLFLILILLTLLPVFVNGQEVSIVSLVTGENIIRARQGAGYNFPFAYEIPPQSTIILTATSADSTWLEVQIDNQTGWVNRDEVDFSPDTPLPILDNLPPEPSTFTENCISLIGDSVAHGDVVYRVPGQGYAVVRTTPLSVDLQNTLVQRGLGYLDMRDRTVSAAFLSEQGKFPYTQTTAYNDLLEDRCRFTVVMPWINDMSIEREDNANAHVRDLANLLSTLQRRNIGGKVLVLGFYYGQPSEFAERHAPGYVDTNIALFNDALFSACASDVSLGSFRNVTCMETERLFTDPDNSHVALAINQTDLTANLYEPFPEDVRPFFEAYWRSDPDATVFGDGVHLSEQGKQILSNAIIDQLLVIDPNL